MIKLPIKAISFNRAYQGRRFATPELKKYKRDVALLLPPLQIPKTGKLRARYVFGVSSKASDADNLVKGIQDILAEVYGFNDKMIYRLEVEKVDVKQKGDEYIMFEIY